MPLRDEAETLWNFVEEIQRGAETPWTDIETIEYYVENCESGGLDCEAPVMNCSGDVETCWNVSTCEALPELARRRGERDGERAVVG